MKRGRVQLWSWIKHWLSVIGTMNFSFPVKMPTHVALGDDSINHLPKISSKVINLTFVFTKTIECKKLLVQQQQKHS